MKLFRISTVPISLNILLKGQLKYLNQFYTVTAISGAGKDLDEVREREGVKTHPLKIARPISPFQDLASLWKLYRYFKKEKPDIIHSITPKAGLLSMIAGKMAGVPVRMHTFTGLIFPHKEGHFQTLLIWMDRMLCYFATHVYPEGNGVKQDLLDHHITRKPLEIIGNGNVNGIDTEYFSQDQISGIQKKELRAKLGISENDFVFIFVGRLVKDKGTNELVAAFQAINNQQLAIGNQSASSTSHNRQNDNDHPQPTHKPSNPQTLKLTHSPTHPLTNPLSNPQTLKPSNSSTHPLTTPKLLLVGPLEQHLDPLSSETLQAIEKNPGIISVGFQQDVRPYFAVADALVFPSYREGFPNVVLQALAMQLPAIVSDINGCREIIYDGENGMVVPPKNSESLTLAMQEIMNDEQYYFKMKEKTRESVEKFRQDFVWEALLEEYRRVSGFESG